MTNDVAAETADLLIATGGLPTESLHMMLTVFAGLANKCDGYSPYERDLFHSVARLLARVRDIRERRHKALCRAGRQARLQATSGTNAELREEFDAIVGTN